MPDFPPAPYSGLSPSASDTPVARAIRFAVYLTGGIVLFAFGLSNIAGSLGEVLNCLYQTTGCSEGFSPSIYLDTVPLMVAGAVMVLLALVLFLLAYRNR